MLRIRIPIKKYWLTEYPNLAPNAEFRVIPDLFGEKHNIVPVCIDMTTLTYKIAYAVNDGIIDKGIEAIDKVSVDGEVLVEGLGYTINLGNAELTLVGTAKLAASTKYNLIIEGDYGVSAVNYISTRRLTTAPYPGGTAKIVDNNGNWTDVAGDVLFHVYGKDTLDSPETFRTGSLTPANNYFKLRDDNARFKLAQSFTTPAGGSFYVSRVQIIIRRFGTPSGSMWITIFTDDAVISAFSDYSGTVVDTVKVTTAGAHGLSTDDLALIGNTTNYNGPFTITRIDATNFYFTHAWDGDDATGIVKGQVGELSDALEVNSMKSTGLRGRQFLFPQRGAESGSDEVSEVLVDAKGYINSDDLYMEKGADILEFILKHRLKVDDSNINAAAFTAFAAARTQVLSIYLDSEVAFGQFIEKLETTLLFKFEDNLDREIIPIYYEAGEPGGTPHLKDEDMRDFSSERVFDVKQKIQVLYNRNPLTSEFFMKEVESKIAEYFYKNKETLQLETFLFVAADALALANAYSPFYEKPRHWISFKTGGAGWDLIPTNKIKITRTRGDYAGGTFDAVLFRMMGIQKSVSKKIIGIRALLDIQTY